MATPRPQTTMSLRRLRCAPTRAERLVRVTCGRTTVSARPTATQKSSRSSCCPADPSVPSSASRRRRAAASRAPLSDEAAVIAVPEWDLPNREPRVWDIAARCRPAPLCRTKTSSCSGSDRTPDPRDLQKDYFFGEAEGEPEEFPLEPLPCLSLSSFFNFSTTGPSSRCRFSRSSRRSS